MLAVSQTSKKAPVNGTNYSQFPTGVRAALPARTTRNPDISDGKGPEFPEDAGALSGYNLEVEAAGAAYRE
jgi:hypothetical protein